MILTMLDDYPGFRATVILRQGSKGWHVRELQRHLGLVEDGNFGPATAAEVVAFQARNQLAADGVVGPATWSAIRRSFWVEPNHAYPFIIECLRDWALVVRDPGHEDKIKDYFRNAGFGWHVADGYIRGTGQNWCGHFVTVNAELAGLHCPGRTMSSVDRLWGRGPAGSRWEDHGISRSAVSLLGQPILPGDVCVVRYDGGPEWGNHIVVALTEVRPDGNFVTVEGNGLGERGDGTFGRGVVRRLQAASRVVQHFRLLDRHA
jgi:hypothetical protein